MKLAEIFEYFQPTLYEMSNYTSDDTGLVPGTKLWIREEPTGLPHTKYRVKFDHPQHGQAIFSLWGDEAQQVAGNWNVSGKDLKKILYLIQLTNKVMRKHIDGIIDSQQLNKIFSKVKQQVLNI